MAEYVQSRYPDDFAAGRYEFQAALGPLSQGLTSRLAPRADAVVFNERYNLLIEAKVEYPHQALGQVISYLPLFPITPRFNGIQDRPLLGVILLASNVPDIEALAHSHGIQTYVFIPDWLREYLVENRRRAV